MKQDNVRQWLGAPPRAPSVAAQPQLSLSSTAVSPGQSLTITTGSSVNSGFSYAGSRSASDDVIILATCTLGQDGMASVSVRPAFNGSILDRYYLQAATSTSPNFNPLQVSSVGWCVTPISFPG